MRRSVKYARAGENGTRDMILEFSTRMVERAMPDKPDYAAALKLSDALQDLYSALEACRLCKGSGNEPSYALEVRICKDTVSHQLTRDGDAALAAPLPAHAGRSGRKPGFLQAIIRFWRAYTLCLHGGHWQLAGMDDLR